MTQLTLAQIEDLLTNPDAHTEPIMAKYSWREESYDIREELGWEFWKYEGNTQSPIYVPGLGSVTVADEYGGEGQGDDYWVVVKVTDMEDGSGTRYFRADGYYASYVGGTFDGGMREVTPTERMVTFYE